MLLRTLGCGLLVCAVTLEAQPRPPSFLADAPLNPRLETLHLEAQADAPVRIGADGRGTVTVVVTPKPRMHVYAADADGYVPFTMKVEAVSAVAPGKVTYPAAETYVFPPTGETSRVYMKPFKVTQAIVLGPEARKTLATEGRVNGVVTLRYQACDDTVCYRPNTGRFGFDITR
jgi:Disulphide bond corrector protein DsbC